MNVQSVGASLPQAMVSKAAVASTDRDGDRDHSTAASDAAEAAKAAAVSGGGPGQLINATA